MIEIIVIILSIIHISLISIILWYTRKHMGVIECHQKIIEEHQEILEKHIDWIKYGGENNGSSKEV